MQYRTGSVAVTNGSQVVTGLGTSWLANIYPGSLFALPSTDGIYYVASIQSNTQLTLTGQWQGDTLTGQRYWITTDFTPRRGLPVPSRQDIEPTRVIAEAFNILDQQLQPAPHGIFTVLDKDLATPPSDPADGDGYIVPTAATGAWFGQDSKIAYFERDFWTFYEVSDQAFVKVEDENEFYFYSAADNEWVENPLWAIELETWYNGTLAGGPNSDGYYPFTTKAGVTTYHPCPAKMLDIMSNGNVEGVLAALNEAVGGVYAPIEKTADYTFVTADKWKTFCLKSGSDRTFTIDPDDFTVGDTIFCEVHDDFIGMIVFRDNLGGTTRLRNEINAFTTAHPSSTVTIRIVWDATQTNKLARITGGVA